MPIRTKVPGKRPIDFVVVGFGRSGFKYMSTVLSKLGVKAGHELSFSHNRQTDHRDTTETWGDVSWLATPYIAQLPETTTILWQTRDPIKVLDSCLPGKGSLVGKARASGPYARFVARHLPNLEGEDEKERILYWYCHWFDMIRKHASPDLAGSGRVAYMYKLEDMADPTGDILDVCFLTGASTEKVTHAIEHTSPLTNHKHEIFPWAKDYLKEHDTEVTRRVIEIINQLGYSGVCR